MIHSVLFAQIATFTASLWYEHGVAERECRGPESRKAEREQHHYEENEEA